MNSTIKGRTEVNGHSIEIEAVDVSAFAAAMKALAYSTGAKNVGGRPRKDEATAQATRVTGNGNQRRKVTSYRSWDKTDVVAIARLAQRFGDSSSGFARAAYNQIKREGVDKARNYKSAAVMAGGIHRFMHSGNAEGMAQQTVDILRQEGFAPTQAA